MPSIGGSPSLLNSFTVSCHPSSIIRNFGEHPPSKKLLENMMQINNINKILSDK